MIHSKKTITLVLASIFASFLSVAAVAGPVFNSSSYSADIVFQDALSSTSMTIAYDGASYWSASGGSPSGTRYAQYDAGGSSVATFAPGIDFRSVFTDNSGAVYARGFASNVIYKQISPGVFVNHLTLLGGTLDAQSAVVMNDNGDFVAMSNGNVNIWNASGGFAAAFTLAGYSGSYPENRGIAVEGNYLLTYFNQTLSAWDYSGALLDQTTLTGAGTGFDSYFSLSYTNDHVFIVDGAGQSWRGYDVGLANNAVPEPATLALLGLGLAGIAFSKRHNRKA